MSLFHDLRRSIDTMGRLQEKFDARYEPAPTTDKGVKLTDGSVAVGGHAYHLGGAWGLDIANGEEIDVRNAGRPAAADYSFNNVRRLRDKLPYQNTSGLMVVEEDGNPAVFGVTQIVVTSGTLTDNKGGSVSIDTGGGTGGGATLFSGGMWGDLIQGAVSVSQTNISGATISYSAVKLACYPAAPTGGITVILHVGANSHTLTITASGTASGGMSFAPDNLWINDADAYVEITSLAGVYTGSILYTIGNS